MKLEIRCALDTHMVPTRCLFNTTIISTALAPKSHQDKEIKVTVTGCCL